MFDTLIHLEDWEDLLMMMKPEGWTPSALKQATIIFTKTECSDDMAQRFLNLIILPRFRDEVAQFKRLNTYIFDVFF